MTFRAIPAGYLNPLPISSLGSGRKKPHSSRLSISLPTFVGPTNSPSDLLLLGQQIRLPNFSWQFPLPCVRWLPLDVGCISMRGVSKSRLRPHFPPSQARLLPAGVTAKRRPSMPPPPRRPSCLVHAGRSRLLPVLLDKTF